MKKYIISTLLIFVAFNTLLYCQDNFDSIIEMSQNQRFEEAEKAIEKLIIDSQSLTEVQLIRAHNFAWWGKNDLAIILFEEILEKNKTHIDAMSGLAYVYRSQGLHAKAVQYFSMMLKEEPKNVNAHKGLMYCYLDTDKLEGAEYHINVLRNIQADEAELYYAEGILNLKRYDYNLARAQFISSLKLDPNYHPSIFQLSRMINNSAKWEITPWIGITNIGEESKIGLRRLDMFYNASNKNLIYAYWDNTLSFENKFLLSNNESGHILGLGNSHSWNKWISSNLSIGHRFIADSKGTLYARFENNIFLSDRFRLQPGIQIELDNGIKNYIYSITSEIKVHNKLFLEASFYHTEKEILLNEERIAFVSKILIGRNIDLLSGVYYDNKLMEDNRSFTFSGAYGIISFPLSKNLFARILYHFNKEITQNTQSLAFGFSAKF